MAVGSKARALTAVGVVLGLLAVTTLEVYEPPIVTSRSERGALDV